MTTHASDLVSVPAHQLKPLDVINGFQVRPGFFRDFGATIIPGGVNFTVQSHGADSMNCSFFTGRRKSLLRSLNFPKITGSVSLTP